MHAYTCRFLWVVSAVISPNLGCFPVSNVQNYSLPWGRFEPDTSENETMLIGVDVKASMIDGIEIMITIYLI